MVTKEYWSLVDADARDWERNQKILFWWVVTCLQKINPNGVIAAPDKSPLSDEQIVEVFEEVLPEEGKSEKSYMDQIWSYQNQTLMFPSLDGNMVRVIDGKIEVVEDLASDQRGIAGT